MNLSLRRLRDDPQRTIAELEYLLEQCAEFLEPYVDVVDGDYGEPAPNKAMSLLSEINAALYGPA